MHRIIGGVMIILGGVMTILGDAMKIPGVVATWRSGFAQAC
jgi:hypothetical protein